MSGEAETDLENQESHMVQAFIVISLYHFQYFSSEEHSGLHNNK